MNPQYDEIDQSTEAKSGKVLGNTAQVRFPQVGNKTVEGKVDTGATTSSLHATNVKMGNGKVSFVSSVFGGNVVTLPLAGQQEVHSANSGADKRPMVKLDIEIDGVQIQGAEFNLNDRSNMDSTILIGQNVLQAGNFTIDPNKGGEETQAPDATTAKPRLEDEKALEAIRILAESGLTFEDFVRLLQTEAIRRIKG